MGALAEVARIRAAEERRDQLLDELVAELLEEHGEVCSSTLADALRDTDRECWRTRRYAVRLALQWLDAAEERGELESEIRRHPSGGFVRRWFWRPV